MILDPAAWFSRPLTDEIRMVLKRRIVIHKTRGCHYESIVGKLIGFSSGGYAIHQVELLPSSGAFRNMTVLDSKGVRSLTSSQYLWCFLGHPGAVAEFANVNTIGRSRAERDSASLNLMMRGDRLLAHCGERMYFRAVDNALAIEGGYRGPAIVDPTRHLPTQAA